MTFLLVLFWVLCGEVLTSKDGITMVLSRNHPNLLRDCYLQGKAKGLRFEHGGAKLVSCHGRHPTSLRPWSLPTALHNLSSRQFCSKVSDLFLTEKTNAWHLHGCNTVATAILCMLRFGHSRFNIDGHCNQICQCGAIKTEVPIFHECLSTYTSCQTLITNVSKILGEENISSHSEFTTLNHWTNQNIFFGNPEPSKNPSLCLFKQTCFFCQSTHPFNITSPSTVFSVCNVLYVCLCTSLFLLTFALPMTSSGLGLPSLAVCKEKHNSYTKFVGGNLSYKSFLDIFGKFEQNILRTPENWPAPTPMAVGQWQFSWVTILEEIGAWQTQCVEILSVLHWIYIKNASDYSGYYSNKIAQNHINKKTYGTRSY